MEKREGKRERENVCATLIQSSVECVTEYTTIWNLPKVFVENSRFLSQFSFQLYLFPSTFLPSFLSSLTCLQILSCKCFSAGLSSPFSSIKTLCKINILRHKKLQSHILARRTNYVARPKKLDVNGWRPISCYASYGVYHSKILLYAPMTLSLSPTMYLTPSEDFQLVAC